MKLKALLLDEKAINRTLIRVSHEIIERNKGVEDLVLLGIKTRGYPLAKRIANYIKEIEGKEVPVGSVDITLYRDDLTILNGNIEVRNLDLGLEIKDKKIVIIDDVLYTCRTVRAAIDAIIDVSRPTAIQLAVLIDRGHKELPIRADYVGKNIPTSKSEIIAVSLKETDEVDSVKIYDSNCEE
ncbi:MAG: bifunctional pyr operon transcriptional regulator/uracil phosphoribosyltransferase PyrR [Clostridium sp.]|uniref:bifunctional pyr operon transcriptional regulator/uracil phosphoribosyltransferase PyrR n=1 Tax=Clostridium sp. TaxID=1506 RepID=UPI0025B7F0A0|nr:bifunctional pyr operon transcriptional regulator/uracil phosphoribosyltransferase PyrR [Clostridium sp.]MCE5221431.1 bifunctional pyr operon transcriptional regulator/uracil phosphoribosyltransferase PyrR [Clostridium sp.]